VRKLLLAVAVIAAVAVVPAVAIGAGFEGTAEKSGIKPLKALPPDSKVQFNYYSIGKKIVEVRGFLVTKVPAKCKGGVIKKVRVKIKKIAVNKNKFKTTVKKGKKTLRAEGKFTQGGAKASGKVSAKGKFGKAKNCKTGKYDWVAVRS